MKNKTLKIGTVLLSLIIIYFIIFLIQGYIIKGNIEDYVYSYEYNVENIRERKSVRCNYNILSPKIANVEFEKKDDWKEFSVSFWKGDIFFKLNKENWKEYYMGGTTIKNTTYEEVLEMVKNDCSQFQEAKGKYDDIDINWSYAKYDRELEEERDKERLAEEFNVLMESKKSFENQGLTEDTWREHMKELGVDLEKFDL